MRSAVLALGLALAGCASPASHMTHHAATPVHAAPRTPCALPPVPVFPDSDAALAAATGLAERVQRLRDGRDARIDYERRLRAACH